MRIFAAKIMKLTWEIGRMKKYNKNCFNKLRSRFYNLSLSANYTNLLLLKSVLFHFMLDNREISWYWSKVFSNIEWEYITIVTRW